ncbi:MAG: hypothetical protein K9J37_10130 [Saprospiraceae bacterium]|nr:hypothetical protein [Saprospiraceae bacterium]MCF8250260.1 hypothetical protein [Saprospiraceae bacterium]MCF8280912.1 hypothetical protein [Bacteroidales bacterium]MCF8312108.1 hypothetical protein [Saprospiraceae bacterium]MCF8440515.1 hypothetical protein [Saprospiraceae bacterium]
MGSIAEHKLHLIQQISAIDDPKDLELLEKELEKIKAGKEKKAEKKEKEGAEKPAPIDYKKLLVKPMRKTLDVEAIKREQGWKGKHDKEKMDRLIKEMNIQEPIEELLAMLTK